MSEFDAQRDKITGVMMRDPEFQIRTEEDARFFLAEVVQFGSFRVEDLDQPGFHFIISKDGRKDSVAVVGHEPDTKHWHEPVLMYSGQKAVEMIFDGRRSINRYLRGA